MNIKYMVWSILMIGIPLSNSYCQNYDSLTNFNTLKLDSLQYFINSNKEIFGLHINTNQQKYLELSNEIDITSFEVYKDYQMRSLQFEFNDQKKVINENLTWALNNTIPDKESETLTSVRKYLGISRNIFAIILAIIHVSTYL
jgi:hypothetical protein